MNDTELLTWYHGQPYIASLGPLELLQPMGMREMVLARPWGVRVGDRFYVVPAGMETDGASIPRLFWRLLDPPMFSRLFPGAVLHDGAYGGLLRCYTTQRDWIPVSRRDADRLIVLVGCWNGYAAWKGACVYRALRACGGPAWRRGHKLNAGWDNRRLMQYDIAS